MISFGAGESGQIRRLGFCRSGKRAQCQFAISERAQQAVAMTLTVPPYPR